MSGKELIRHLHMGCGEPLKTILNTQLTDKKTKQEKLDKQKTQKVEKALQVN